MTSELLAQLSDLCRDPAALDRLKQILADEIQPLEQQIIQANFQLERQKTLFGVISRLRNPLDLETIFQATATEVRQLMGADRVGMFRFYPDAHWNDGEFVSEDVDPEFDSAIA
jgi:light-regulated signal transduction histidine kinase (bacteriophytochrome)